VFKVRKNWCETVKGLPESVENKMAEERQCRWTWNDVSRTPTPKPNFTYAAV